MSIVVTNAGKAQALSYLVGKDNTVETLYLKLYSNDVTPANTSAATSFTEVASANGYASIELDPADWTVVEGQAAYPEITWDFTGAAGNIYGYYVVTGTSNTVILAERFSNSPYNVANDGDELKLTVVLNLTN
jgi:hypothetical protein